jgi:hypothetical protein
MGTFNRIELVKSTYGCSAADWVIRSYRSVATRLCTILHTLGIPRYRKSTRQ